MGPSGHQVVHRNHSSQGPGLYGDQITLQQGQPLIKEMVYTYIRILLGQKDIYQCQVTGNRDIHQAVAAFNVNLQSLNAYPCSKMIEGLNDQRLVLDQRISIDAILLDKLDLMYSHSGMQKSNAFQIGISYHLFLINNPRNKLMLLGKTSKPCIGFPSTRQISGRTNFTHGCTGFVSGGLYMYDYV